MTPDPAIVDVQQINRRGVSFLCVYDTYAVRSKKNAGNVHMNKNPAVSLGFESASIQTITSTTIQNRIERKNEGLRTFRSFKAAVSILYTFDVM